MRLLVAACVVTVAIVATPSTGASGGGTGVDAFVVRLQPNGVVCIEAPCWLPVKGVPVSIVRNGKVVVRVISGSDGHARVRLAPGLYLVRAPGVVALPSFAPRIARVVEGRMTRTVLPLPGKASIPPPPG